MKIRTIKNVDDETWKQLKEMARRRRLKMGALLKEIAMEYKKRPSDSWNNILNVRPILAKEQAEAMLKMVVKIRKESGYRNVIIT